jgi:hypothetical protein
VAGVQPVVLWQVSQAWVVGIWVEDLPVAEVPLWQVAQDPGATPSWVNFAGVQAFVVWHASQAPEVGK